MRRPMPEVGRKWPREEEEKEEEDMRAESRKRATKKRRAKSSRKATGCSISETRVRNAKTSKATGEAGESTPWFVSFPTHPARKNGANGSKPGNSIACLGGVEGLLTGPTSQTGLRLPRPAAYRSGTFTSSTPLFSTSSSLHLGGVTLICFPLLI